MDAFAVTVLHTDGIAVGAVTVVAVIAEFVIGEMRVAETDLKLHVPVFGEHPVIAVGQSSSHEPSLRAEVIEVVEAVTEVDRFTAEVAHVHGSCMGMECEEMSTEFIAEPVACFRLEEEVFEQDVRGHLPCVEVGTQVEAPAGSQCDLHAEVGREGRIVEEVGFQCNVLCLSVLRGEDHTQYKGGEGGEAYGFHRCAVMSLPRGRRTTLGTTTGGVS